jgi:hypothetical protein
MVVFFSSVDRFAGVIFGLFFISGFAGYLPVFFVFWGVSG